MSGKTPGVDALEMAETGNPEPGDGELLVRVCHAALNFSDLLMIDEKYQVRPPRPFIPGQEIAGIVEEAPSGVPFSAGDRIASKVLWGGFADYVCARADMAIKVPAGFSLSHAVALPVSYVTALVALDHCARVRPGDTVLVHAAAGGIGLAAVEVAAARGANVIATASAPDRLAVAQAHGASHCINYTQEGWYRQVRDLTEGVGANIIVDPVGGRVGEDSLRCIAVDGCLLVVGFSSGTMPQLAANRLLLKRASAKGVYWNHDTDADLLKQVYADLFDLVSSGKIDPVVDTDRQFDELPAALGDLASRKVTGKMALRISDEGESR
ncbi:NADPH:quinone oxidoreductase family protein [Hoeflea sp.]|uniref:NADPH:quinone oxidoreductase family protein n=1 Tax=Hoeflea sp. TaxID=1940281 RepID=UPI003B026D97